MNAPLVPRSRLDAFRRREPLPDGLTPGFIRRRPKPLGARLVEAGLLDPGDLARALALQSQQDAPLGELLTAKDMVKGADVLLELAAQAEIGCYTGQALRIDKDLRADIEPRDCLMYSFLPFQRLSEDTGRGTRVAVTDPDDLPHIARKIPPRLKPLEFVLVAPHTLQEAIATEFAPTLVRKAEALTEPKFSCRNGSSRTLLYGGLILLTVLAICALVDPITSLRVALTVGFAAMATTALLKAASLCVALRRTPKPARPKNLKLPKFSILVPLYKEAQIAETLIKRLSRLNYPTELTEILLVFEAEDDTTRNALRGTKLPRNIRAITVPDGTLKTKPRAMNYALDFTSGTYLGIYDAEDAPAPDQLHRVAETFAIEGDKTACVQGVLSFYNWPRNWLSRCFFFEYAGWFRVMLPGLARLGFAIPLGGTTVFFRRDVLLKLGGWDAHNVTEDADLGIRLARFGYKTAVIDTVTEEEANARIWPWIRQRSRWLKGYAITWAVHMRRPRQLLRDLGWQKFLGFQALFLGTLTSFFLAPAFWITSAAIVTGLATEMSLGLTRAEIIAASALFLGIEMLNLTMYCVAARKIKARPNLFWALSLPAYFIFASLATYKAFAELWRKPFFWDKTEHGEFGGVPEEPDDETGSEVLYPVGLNPKANFKRY